MAAGFVLLLLLLWGGWRVPCLYVCVPRDCLMPVEATRQCIPGTGVTDGCELPCVFWDTNPGPLKEQQMLLTPESPLQPLEYHLNQYLKQILTESFSYLIHFIDSNSKLCHSKRTDQKAMLPRLSSSLKSSFKLSPAGINY